MAPLPKHRHSTQRKGKRMKTRLINFPKLVKCGNCGKLMLPHKLCGYCKK
ncbi:50S ribosomal protein L32 [Candidatus Roizmanbacteria bacterium CG02_land_8_20_14_3_00_36_15]|uniref:Large ribosomal subunit protein bL32 n=2 Tax=Candidatus Roizmaniibacteriota TaxID=1752723 RepID=A0A2M8KL15_9BACT|nr:MAG: 50S ribosomal protein L32 [Candidatus Roizmanbacteria bacterium CG03_land_8_20_14_0_80_36_21]PIV37283.1 MAG: 50S ribosomal protein L32 [Candidatus Roizmanbacteria bacterium CG02_land_8_20_14_3_00_36_15]PIY70652.1 MAG: 50S ribosomal protein L32 [Candidatus Roizmanbacteria bacterium CG_4_10_14_0_8_um_filter_36_36]PJA53095.1 MAG: 50S ribosomal protein L32 [Candidatus Roizmanbacteria bacterium CG_4_9_14_3_um_filter_36_11]PJC81280.1 MAG: 50S ribosomal protein L32 [Candidatus Roizmanbacteria 